MLSWTDIQKRPNAKTLRQFAVAWLLFFVALGARQYFKQHHHPTGVALAALGLIIGSLGLLRPAAIRPLFIGSMIVAFPIGWLVSTLMLLLMFYVVITPVALLLRLRGRDSLHLRRNANASTYWLPKQTPADPRSYLRQY